MNESAGTTLAFYPQLARRLTEGRREQGYGCHVENNNTILVVDDDKDTCSNLSDILNDLGYSVDVAYRGDDALSLFKQHSYRLALLDYKLPCMTGVELFQRMRQINENVKGFLITGYASNETAKDALAGGMRHIFHKPVEMPKLMPMIEEALA